MDSPIIREPYPEVPTDQESPHGEPADQHREGPGGHGGVSSMPLTSDIRPVQLSGSRAITAATSQRPSPRLL